VRKHVSIFGIILLLLPCYAVAQTSSSPAVKLSAEIEKLKKDPDMLHAAWGLCVLDAKSGKTISEYNSQASLTPASTLKVVTTAAALSILGPGFRYETTLEYDGTLDTVTGILKGNVYIRGGGDPSLGSELFRVKNDTLVTDKWAMLLKAKGIRQVDGAVIGDAEVFEDEMIPSTWIWGDIGNYFGAGASGLTFMDNKYTAFFKSGTAGDTTSITKISPEVPGLYLRNMVTSGGSGDNAFIYGAPYDFSRYVTGTVPAGRMNYEVDGSIPDPPLFCAQMLEVAMKREGITLAHSATTVRQLKFDGQYKKGKRSVIDTHYSPTLDKIVYYTNLKSNNLFAEHLMKTIAWKKTGYGTDTAGKTAILNYWSSKGIDTKGLYMTDGCGLSRANTITAAQLAGMLRAAKGESYFNPFYASLPVAGRSGSLGSLCVGTCAENNLHAKSGYINRVRSYAGYVKNKKGDDVVFALIANNYDCTPVEMKKKLEKIMVLIAELE
jgi:D-alanyl-D-alanine carboxypeptidase/D-alanyl-D-alanine-endopeptidase (penicillin-binding protein 4)